MLPSTRSMPDDFRPPKTPQLGASTSDAPDKNDRSGAKNRRHLYCVKRKIENRRLMLYFKCLRQQARGHLSPEVSKNLVKP